MYHAYSEFMEAPVNTWFHSRLHDFPNPLLTSYRKTMKLQIAATLSSIAVTLSLATAPAQAFSGFSFTTNYSPKPADPRKDIKLEYVKYGGKTIGNFGLVDRAEIRVNDTKIGPGSSDHGVDTVLDTYLPQGPNVEKPTNADVVASLGNLNLNSIIDTEDNRGTSIIDVYFKKAARTFYFFERGMNSDLTVEALDAAGTVVDNYTITRALFHANPTGYSLHTTEIDKAQPVGSYGLTLSHNVAGLRLSSNNPTMNGPDYKVVAKVPEPTAIAALGIVAGIAALSRRKKNQAVSTQAVSAQ